jgi:hypothetical protein
MTVLCTLAVGLGLDRLQHLLLKIREVLNHLKQQDVDRWCDIQKHTATEKRKTDCKNKADKHRDQTGCFAAGMMTLSSSSPLSRMRTNLLRCSEPVKKSEHSFFNFNQNRIFHNKNTQARQQQYNSINMNINSLWIPFPWRRGRSAMAQAEQAEKL